MELATGVQGPEHRASRNMIERANGVNGENGSAWACFGGSAEQATDGFGAGTGAEAVRMWHARFLELRRKIFGEHTTKKLSTIKSFITASRGQPVADDFADMLENLCASDPHAPTKPRLLDEVPFTRDELKHADKACDEVGLVARTSTLQLFFQLRRFHVLPVTIVQHCTTMFYNLATCHPHGAAHCLRCCRRRRGRRAHRFSSDCKCSGSVQTFCVHG